MDVNPQTPKIERKRTKKKKNITIFFLSFFQQHFDVNDKNNYANDHANDLIDYPQQQLTSSLSN
ncbi:hypothetical protein DERP_001934 [Dermatophagoides pteronyssinus]|uniref:Uncharacterized protein n=1 Tax=Dermatophagoides pteronyssinus TaxID=6956 RepID=A0ABQ8JBV7_DERPT|nr:hypothetical protein DERP_001934 [Dermatophagoides pteronyssinus]